MNDHTSGIDAEKLHSDFETDFFEKQLFGEILHSQRRRSLILATIFTLLPILMFIVPPLMPSSPGGTTTQQLGPPIRPYLALLLAACAVYELLLWLYLKYDRNPNKLKHTALRYITALLEISIPTGILFLWSLSLSPPSLVLVQPSVFLYFIFIILATLQLDFRLCVFTGLVAAIEYAVLATFLMNQQAVPNAIFTSRTFWAGSPLLIFIAGVTAAFVTSHIKKQVVNSITAVQKHNRIMGIFGQHVSPKVAEKLVGSTPEGDGEIRKACVMFLDIRNFTSFSETKAPDEVVRFLNTLFGSMIKIINANGGLINKFLGDGFMALFGVPQSTGNDAADAVRAALQIHASVKSACERGEIPETKIGIGLHTGNTLTGCIGSALRKEYSVIGDVVNLASRVESLNKQFGSQILITGAVLDALGEEPQIEAEPLGPVMVKGRREPVQIFRLA